MDRITSERLLEEMNGPIFRDYLDKSIGHTRNSGYETSFEIFRSPSQDQFYYPLEIVVGDNNSVSKHYHERHLKLIVEFEKQHGKKPKIAEYGRNNTKNFIDAIVKYDTALKKYLKKKGECFKIPMEPPPGRDDSVSIQLEDAYTFLGAHTHPTQRWHEFKLSLAIPSINDLKHLRYLKRETNKILIINSEIIQSPVKLVANPLSLIAGSAMTDNGYFLGLLTCYNPRVSDEKLMEFQKKMLEEQDIVEGSFHELIHDGNFCFAKGFYDPKKGVIFSPNSLDVLLEAD